MGDTLTFNKSGGAKAARSRAVLLFFLLQEHLLLQQFWQLVKGMKLLVFLICTAFTELLDAKDN